VAGLVATALVLGAAPALAQPAEDQEMPFPCGQEWYGSTRSGHSPSWYSIDWNAPDDLGKPVVASGAGVVSRVENLGSSSYGLYAVIDHGNGESTLYAHMSAEFVTVGQRIDQGELLGRVGESGGVTGPHLHYEQRQDGRDQQPWFHGRSFTFDSSLTSRSCVDTPVAGDWDGDGTDEVGVFRRGVRGAFKLDAGDSVRTALWGSPVDQPVVGDWDGDGTPDLGVRQPATGTFVRQGADGPMTPVTFGQVADRPVSGDWDGDGVTDIGVWRPAGAVFLLRSADGSVRQVKLGSVGSLPVTGDWNGDGRTDLGAFSAGTWSLRLTRADGSTWSDTMAFGQADALPITGDWNGDGADDLGVWSPGSAVFTLRSAAPMSRRATALVTQRFGRAR
jgi:hypothetical protein